jgi:hypothetical protein
MNLSYTLYIDNPKRSHLYAKQTELFCKCNIEIKYFCVSLRALRKTFYTEI